MTLIGKLDSNPIHINILHKWALLAWKGVSNIFFIDQREGFFITMFESKVDHDRTHKQKDWFCEGIGLYTLPWLLNFNTKSIGIKFVPRWFSFPSLPLEYRGLDLVEAMENHLDIFMKHELIPFEHTERTVRACIFIDLSKLNPAKIIIDSKFGSYTQEVVMDDPNFVNEHNHLLGHLTSQCSNPVQQAKTSWCSKNSA